MKVHLPNSAFIGNIDSFLASINPSDQSRLTVTSNKRWISLHPLVLSMVGALGMCAPSGNIDIETIEAKSGHYLVTMGLYRLLGLDAPAVTHHEAAGRYIPLTCIKNSEELSIFIRDLVPLLHLSDTPQQAKSIMYVVDEVVRNVLEHARCKHGAIMCAQYFGKSNTVRIGIADTGIGIKTSIEQSHHPKDDIEAIALSLRPGITGTTSKVGGTDENAGAGLFFTKSIAFVNRSYFMVYSGSAMYKLRLRPSQTAVTRLYSDPFKDNHSTRSDLPYWPGTAVGIDISLNDTGEFAALLELIHKVYSTGIKDKRSAQYKKARFID